MFSLSNCGQNPTVTQVKKSVEKDTLISKDTIAIDSNLTRLSNLMAGMDTLVNYQHQNWSLDSIKLFSKESSAKYLPMLNTRLVKINEWNK